MQGLPKKIKIDLLLADLALQFGNPLARLLDLSHRLLRRRPLQLFLRSTFAPQRFRATGSKTRPPIIQVMTFSPAIIRRTAASLNARLKMRDLFLGISPLLENCPHLSESHFRGALQDLI